MSGKIMTMSELLRFLASLALLGCGSVEQDRAHEPFTSDCVTGVWISQDLPCQCPPPESGLATPECGTSACQQSTVYVFDKGGVFFQAIVQRTSTTFSAVGAAAAVSQGTWKVEAGNHLVTTTTPVGGSPRSWDTEATCDASHLQRVGASGYARPSPGLGAALQDAAHTGVWTHHSYSF